MARVLVVEDDADSRELLSTFLRRWGYDVESASNGREALNSIIESRPDAAVVDLYMPELDGAGLLEVIRSYARLQDLPVIVWTGIGSSNLTVEHARRLNVEAVLTKSKATLNDVLTALHSALPPPPT